MRILQLEENSRKNLLDQLLKRSPNNYGEYMDRVSEIVDRVRKEGDAALFDYTSRFDGAQVTAETVRVTPGEVEEAYRQVEPELLEVIRKALKNIRAYHEKQRRYSWFDSGENGTMLGQKITPIASCGVDRKSVV